MLAFTINCHSVWPLLILASKINKKCTTTTTKMMHSWLCARQGSDFVPETLVVYIEIKLRESNVFGWFPYSLNYQYKNTQFKDNTKVLNPLAWPILLVIVSDFPRTQLFLLCLLQQQKYNIFQYLACLLSCWCIIVLQISALYGSICSYKKKEEKNQRFKQSMTFLFNQPFLDIRMCSVIPPNSLTTLI